MSITKLIEHVLEEVSIDGSEGTTIKQLFIYVTDFYTKTLIPKVEINSLCGPPQNPWGNNSSKGVVEPGPSTTPPNQPVYWGVPNMKDEFQDYVWDILRQQNDFKVGIKGEGNKLSLNEIIVDLRNQAEGNKKGTNGEGKVWKVYTSDERHWKTLTGHGPDLKRVPNAVFKCLEVIAKHREQGLIQPELTKITGQDKKSVAGRTTILKNLGLIEKVAVLAKSLSTSKLTLTKFALQRDIKLQAAQESKEAVVKKRGKKALDSRNDAASIAWTGATIDTEKLIKAIFSVLKEAKNQVLMHSDLKRKLGMDKSRFHWRCFSRILRKLESLGVIRRIRVPLKILRKYKKTQGPSEISITEQCHARCVRFIREMEKEDWRKVLTTFSKREIIIEDEDYGEAEGSEDEAAKGSNNIEDEDPVVAQELGQVNVDEAVEEMVRDPPQWRKDKPLTTTIFDIVDSCGKDGISSMDLMYNTIGSFYYRPMDQILHRLTDYPQQSQPPQYMHLAIIRETGISGRQTHYRYFSYRWHQELVAEGVAVQPWGPAIRKKGSKQVSHGAITQVAEVSLSLDKYGFTPPNASRFLKSDGSATLAESSRVGKRNERLDSLKAQFRVLRDGAGEEQLDWKNSSPRGGRPRKYEKGKEPYLAAKRRAEARRIIAERATDPVEPDGANPDETTQGRLLSNELEGDALESEPPPKRARIEDLLNPEDLEPLLPPKRRGRPPGVKNGEGKKQQAAKKREKKPKVTPKKSTKKSKMSQKAQEPEEQEQQEPQVGLNGAEPESGPKENSGSQGKRKAEAAGGKTGRAKRRKETDPQSPSEGDGVIIHDSIVVRPSTELAPDTNTINSAESAITELTPGSGQPVVQLSKEPARVVDGVQLEIEHLDVEGNDSYGSIGGMLAISRQQVVLDLLKENNGVFPSGNELRHAYSKRYQKSNPKAGVCDRRLIRGIVQSLQCRKMAYQITFDFISSRGIFITKKLLIDSRLTPDSPLVDAMVREMITADGNLWFPPNTELHDDIQERFVQPPSWSLSKPRESEEVEFDRVYPTSVSELKQKREARAMERATTKVVKLSVIPKPRGRPRTYPVDEVFNHRAGGKFTDQQREEAANRRRAELKAQRERMKLNHKYRTAATNIDPFDPPLTVDGLPGRSWWNEFVERNLNEPRDADSFLQEICQIERWEKAVGPDGLRKITEKSDGMVMVNLFAPPVEKGDNFVQVPVANMDNIIAADFTAPLATGPKKRGPKPRPKKSKNEPAKARTVDVLMGEQPLKRKRRRPGTFEKPLTRRDRAMAAIRDNQLKPSNADLLTELPPKKFQFRNQYIIPKEDEDTLLIAVIIVRTIFGGWDRKIHWDLLTKALPQHSVITLQRRWPRVRDTHKAHMKKLQTEFEDMFLEAYESGEIPAFNMDDPSSFDLVFHVKWFRENLELPQAQAVPQLPATREAFDAQYDLRVEPPKQWRSDYHNPLMTMGYRVNHFMCHSFDLPLEDEKGKNKDEEEKEVEYIKSVIKANIVTDSPKDNPKRAFEILHSCPERVVDAAFNNLSTSKTIAHKKRDRFRATPGPNYEFTDKFHIALKTPMDENLFAQAVQYERYLEENFAKYKPIEISPLTNDGSMACIFAMVASRKVLLGRSGYVANEFGLIDGYKTRAMDKNKVDFKVLVRPGPDYHQKPDPGPAPPIPRGNMDPASRDPIRLWIGLDGTAVEGMWLKVLTAVVSTITSRPGIPNSEIASVLFPCASPVELDDILAWLVERGCVERKGEGVNAGNWTHEGYFLAFKGLDYLAA